MLLNWSILLSLVCVHLWSMYCVTNWPPHVSRFGSPIDSSKSHSWWTHNMAKTTAQKLSSCFCWTFSIYLLKVFPFMCHSFLLLDHVIYLHYYFIVSVTIAPLHHIDATLKDEKPTIALLVTLSVTALATLIIILACFLYFKRRRDRVHYKSKILFVA